MLLTTTENIAGKNFEVIGMVQGSTVQSKHMGKDIGASFKTMVGGEIKSYTEMLNEARTIATNRMIEEGKKLNADAIVCVRYSTSSVMQGAAESMAYGTAVRFV